MKNIRSIKTESLKDEDGYSFSIFPCFIFSKVKYNDYKGYTLVFSLFFLLVRFESLKPKH